VSVHILKAPVEKEEGYDPHAVRPGRGFVLICVDPRKSEMSCGLIIPMVTNHEQLHEGSGLIIRVNPADEVRLKKIGVGENDRVVYRGYLKHCNKLKPDKMHEKYTDGTPMEWSFISIDDLVMVIEPGVEIGLLSEKK
jgi:hypothetical protein